MLGEDDEFYGKSQNIIKKSKAIEEQKITECEIRNFENFEFYNQK